jgi:hypothetical protein
VGVVDVSLAVCPVCKEIFFYKHETREGKDFSMINCACATIIYLERINRWKVLGEDNYAADSR